MIFTKKLLSLIIWILLWTTTVLSQANNYQYDDQGRIIADHAEGILEVRWNNFNKVSQIIRSDTSTQSDLEFYYDGLGNRITKLEKPRNGQGLLPKMSWKFTHYTRDIYGNIIGIYHQDYSLNESTLSESLFWDEQWLPMGYEKGPDEALIMATYKIEAPDDFENTMPLGVQISASESAYSCRRGEKRYPLENYRTDQLVVIGDRKVDINTGFKSEVWAATDYDPFGMDRSDRNYRTEGYRYGFSGKPNDPEIKGLNNSYDFGARLYDPRLGRWLSPDPHQQDYPGFASYVGMADNPIYYTDPDGKDIVASPAFLKSRFQFIYQYLNEDNSVFKKLISPFGDSRLQHINFHVVGSGRNLLYRYGSYFDQGHVTAKFTFNSDPFRTYFDNGKMVVTRSSELGKVAVLLNAVIKAKYNMFDEKGNLIYESIDVAGDRKILFEGLQEYVQDSKHQYTDEELEILSWKPYENSDVGGYFFKDYIKKRANKNNQSYEQALEDWQTQVWDLSNDTRTTIDPAGNEEVYISPYLRGE